MPNKIFKRVYSAPSRIHGQGLFARLDIEDGDYIGTYKGYRTRQEGRYVLWVCAEGEPCVGRRGLNLLRFLNHADEPNAEFDGFDLYASEDIHIGDEITINYDGPESA